jgi:hypothetical protein
MIVLPLHSWFAGGASPVSFFSENRCIILVNLIEGKDTIPFLEQWLSDNNISFTVSEGTITRITDIWYITFDNADQAILFKMTFM